MSILEDIIQKYCIKKYSSIQINKYSNGMFIIPFIVRIVAIISATALIKQYNLIHFISGCLIGITRLVIAATTAAEFSNCPYIRDYIVGVFFNKGFIK